VVGVRVGAEADDGRRTTEDGSQSPCRALIRRLSSGVCLSDHDRRADADATKQIRDVFVEHADAANIVYLTLSLIGAVALLKGLSRKMWLNRWNAYQTRPANLPTA
jgi:hypothetical protein